MAPASVLFLSLRASMAARSSSNAFRLADVARRALSRGRRKLRAKPSLTVTTSPMAPRLSTRSSRTTFISLHHVGQEGQIAGALDGLGQFALLLLGDGRDARRNDLAALADVALQQFHVLVVDLRRVFAGERAHLAATGEGATGRAGSGRRTRLGSSRIGHDPGSYSAASGAAAASSSRGVRSRSRSRSRSRLA